MALVHWAPAQQALCATIQFIKHVLHSEALDITERSQETFSHMKHILDFIVSNDRVKHQRYIKVVCYTWGRQGWNVPVRGF